MLRRAVFVAAECSYAPGTPARAPLYALRRVATASSPLARASPRIAWPSACSPRRTFVTSSIKGKERASRGGPDETGTDPLIDLLSSLVKKREHILANLSANDHAQAKEMSELDDLHALWKEWQAMTKSIANLLRMTSAEAEPDAEMRELAAEEARTTLDALDELRDRIKSQLLPQDPVDSQNAILEIRPGVGGQESACFVAEVYRMYAKFCENIRDEETGLAAFEIEELSATPTDAVSETVAYKEIIVSVKGKGAYGLLRLEAGVHRVQRIPATQNTGKLQSSTIAMVVLPGGAQGESEVGKKDDVVDPKDVKTEVMRSRGAGGQHVNKTESAIRLTHEPTGITVSMQDSRSQHQNRVKAWAILRARLQDRQMKDEESQNRSVRRLQVAGMDRSDRVRTYNFPQDRVTDHRVPISSNGIDSVMDGEEHGGLAYLIDALKEHHERLVLQQLQQETDAELAQLSKRDSR